jgi:excisionase family DNA binding protein
MKRIRTKRKEEEEIAQAVEAPNYEQAATKRDVAKYFRVTERHIENQMRKGKIPFWRVGRLCRFNLERVKAALEAPSVG